MLLMCIASFAAGYLFNQPPAEAAYDIAEIEAVNQLSAAAKTSDEWEEHRKHMSQVEKNATVYELWGNQ